MPPSPLQGPWNLSSNKNLLQQFSIWPQKGRGSPAQEKENERICRMMLLHCLQVCLKMLICWKHTVCAWIILTCSTTVNTNNCSGDAHVSIQSSVYICGLAYRYMKSASKQLIKTHLRSSFESSCCHDHQCRTCSEAFKRWPDYWFCRQEM